MPLPSTLINSYDGLAAQIGFSFETTVLTPSKLHAYSGFVANSNELLFTRFETKPPSQEYETSSSETPKSIGETSCEISLLFIASVVFSFAYAVKVRQDEAMQSESATLIIFLIFIKDISFYQTNFEIL